MNYQLRLRFKNEPLGADYDLAVQRAEKILLPAFDSWLTGAMMRIPWALEW